MKPIDYAKAAAVGLGVLALNLLLTTAAITVYALAIEPGRPQAHYNAIAPQIGAWSGPAGGVVLMFLAGWFCAKRRPERNGLLFAAVLATSILPAAAAPRGADPSAPQGALQGVVRTHAGDPVPGIVLQLSGPQGRTVITGPGGRYQAGALPAGDYRFEIAESGFVLEPEARARVESVPVTLDLVLSPAPVREQVVVAATRSEGPASSAGASALRKPCSNRCAACRRLITPLSQYSRYVLSRAMPAKRLCNS